MNPQRLDSKTVGEVLTITFSFAGALVSGETITNTVSVLVTPYLGVDTNATAMKNGTANVDTVNGLVFQSITGGLAIVDYLIACRATTNLGRVLEDLAILPVR